MHKLLLIIALCYSFVSLKANDVFGGEIWYEYIGDSTGVAYDYFVYLRLYSDNQQLDSTQNIVITSSCDSSINLSVIRSTPPGFYLPTMRSCNDDSVPNFQYDLFLHQYKSAVTLAGKCSDYTFSYSKCCRTSIVNNIDTSHNMYMEATLNNTLGPNTSPTFLVAPASKFCNLQTAYVSHAAFERDGDSLYYQIEPVKSDFNTSMSYKPGYSAQQPIQTLSGVSFNHRHGTLSFAPSQSQVAAMRFTVSEYRYDTTFSIWLKIGYSTREITYFTGDCISLGNWGFQKDSRGIDTNIAPLCYDTNIIISTKFDYYPYTLTRDGSDFMVLDSRGNRLQVMQATPLGTGIYANAVELELSTSLCYDDTYRIISKTGSDTNTLLSSCGYPLIANDTVRFVLSSCNSQFSKKENTAAILSVYPSPAKTHISVLMPSGLKNEYSRYEIVNQLGQKVRVGYIDFHQNSASQIDIQTLPKAVYLFRLTAKKEQAFLQTFIKE